MSAVVDVKHKKAPIDHIVVRLSLTEARDLVAAYHEAHKGNRYFFDIWGRLPELVNQVSKALGEEAKPRRRTAPVDPSPSLTISAFLEKYSTNDATVANGVRTQS